ncbi:MAG: UPF0175 family protein [Gammaproteobacteria bacterium]|nr:UPF0175 family protein [Gammaproteobacteria bacterium]
MLNTGLPQVNITIPQSILDSARISAAELKREIALTLYAQHRLSIGKARELAEMSLWEFRQLLGFRKIPVHYDEQDLNTDLETIQKLKK